MLLFSILISLNTFLPSSKPAAKASPAIILPVQGTQIVDGLKEALNVGIDKTVSKVSITNGFFSNSLIKIPFPAEAKRMETRLRSIGMNKQVDQVVVAMNKAAENASKEVKPIFIDAIKSITIQDGVALLNGGNNAATEYLRGKTYASLQTKIKPIIIKQLNTVALSSYWTPLMKQYNRFPGVQKVNPDLETYVCEKALNGLFTVLGQEEEKIRKDPAAQTTDLLKSIFGKKK